MVQGSFSILTLFFFLIGLLVFIWGLTWFKRKRLMENTPTSKIRSIAMGFVEIFGKVVPWKNTILKSPLTNSDCVYYKYTVEEYRKSGKSSHWVTIDKGQQDIKFLLKDDTGSVLVDPYKAKISIPWDYEFRSSLGKDPPQTVKNFLNTYNIGFEGFFGINKTMRYREYIIEPHDKLYIMGTADDNPFVDEGTADRGMEDIMIQKGSSNSFYFISDKSEKQILRNLSIGYKLMLFVGLIFITLGVILLI